MDTPKSQTDRSKKYRDFGISVEDAAKELAVSIQDAISFASSELEPDWEKSERYYNGKVDIETFEGRSAVVKTEVRDAIRNTMPSIMRILMQARTPVLYEATSVQHSAWVDQQSEFVTQLFYRKNGYLELYQAILESLKLKRGVLKATWEPDPRPRYVTYTKINSDQLRQLVDDDTFELDDVEKDDDHDLYDVSGYYYLQNGDHIIQSVPNYEFFISKGVNSIEMALARGVHGQKATVSVAEALDMGLDYDDWISLDNDDPEDSDYSRSSTERRGYNKSDDNLDNSLDLSKHLFTLTEVYVRYDLRGTGRAQTYRFYLGGSSYTYLGHEEVDDSPYALVIPIPIPHNAHGHSIADLTISEQDTSTSILRATVDNAHASNGARIAADPQKTNFDDIMNNKLNAPIRKRAGDTIQIVQVPNTGQANLGLLSYLDLDVQQKVGVTKAAQGLDPDALQSTDKNAVMNTIQTAQGQVELMVRNIVETGIVRLFRILLRNAVRHTDPMQLIKTKGKVVPVDLNNFDPDAAAVPNVGLGTAQPQQTIAALNFIYQEQQRYLQQYGPNNPFTSFAQLYNTLEDLMQANSIYNTERYFNIVTPEVEKQWARAEEQARQQMMMQQQANQPMDPSKAFIEVENLKSQDKQREMATKAALDQQKMRLEAIRIEADDDLQRDRMTQDRVIRLAELQSEALNKSIKGEQDKSSTPVKDATPDTPN